MFVTKVVLGEETKRATCLCHQLNQPMHVTDGVTVTPLSARHDVELKIIT